MSSTRRPCYARALRLRQLRPGHLLCFLFLEGSIGFGALLALAELASWWGVLVLPVVVALLVKISDMVVGVATARCRPVPAHGRSPTGGAGVPRTGPRASPPRAADTLPAASRPPAPAHDSTGGTVSRPDDRSGQQERSGHQEQGAGHDEGLVRRLVAEHDTQQVYRRRRPNRGRFD